MKKRSSLLIIYAALGLISVVFLFPFYWAVMSSLKSNAGLDLTPPAFYPAEARKLDFIVPAANRTFSMDGKDWLLISKSPNLLAKDRTPGGYYLRLDGTTPSQQIEWYPDSHVKAALSGAKEICFTGIPVHSFEGKPLAMAGQLVRQNGGSFSELLFVIPDKTKRVDDFQVLCNAKHTEIRDPSLHWENYPNALKGPEASFGEKSVGFLVFMKNSFFIAILAVTGQVLSCSLVAFGFSRLQFKGRELLFVVLLATMMIPGQVTMIPMFAIFKSLGWVDTFLPLIVPAFLGGAFNIFLLRQYMLTIPKELDESAAIDGCGPLRTYWSIIMPNCSAALILVGLFTFMASWGDVMGPLIYLDNPAYRTVPLGLEFFRSPYVDNRSLLMAGAVMAMVPVAVLFIICQKYIMSGIATTGIKG